RQQLHAGAALEIIADDDLAAVEEDAVGVDEGPGAETDVVAVVAEKARHDRRPTVGRVDQFIDQGAPFRRVLLLIDSHGQIDRPRSSSDQFRIAGIIVQSGQHLFTFGHAWIRASATASPMASELVKPGLSIPNSAIKPSKPCCSWPCSWKSGWGSPGPCSFGRMPA